MKICITNNAHPGFFEDLPRFLYTSSLFMHIVYLGLLQNLEKYGLLESDLIKITFVYIFGRYKVLCTFILLDAGKYSCSIFYINMNLSLES